MNNEIYHIITRSFKGTISAPEAEQLEGWINMSTDNRNAYAEMENLWRLSGKLQLDNQFDVNEEWNRFTAQRDIPAKQNTTGSPYLKFYRLAAVLIPFMLLATIFLYRNGHEQTKWIAVSTADEIKNIDLPDGSTILLNRQSEIIYQNNFSNNRNVKIRGEAYFKVAKNGRKFKVDAGNTLVEVLGTEFSVNRSDSVTRVVVAQGRVKFSNKTNNKNNVKLVAGDEGVFNASKMKLTKTINRSENSLAWVNHRLVFTNANMDNVIMDLENYFHVRIITGDEVKTCLFSGSFENPELNNVLEVIALSTGSLIKKENNIFYLEGSSCIK